MKFRAGVKVAVITPIVSSQHGPMQLSQMSGTKELRQKQGEWPANFLPSRVAGLGRLSAGAKMAMKPFVKRVFTFFATNASFLRVISNFRI